MHILITYLYNGESETYKPTVMRSKFLKLNAKDFFRGLLIAMVAAMINGLINVLDNGAVFTWVTIKPVLIAGVSAALSYLLKCLATNSQDQMFKREPRLA